MGARAGAPGERARWTTSAAALALAVIVLVAGWVTPRARKGTPAELSPPQAEPPPAASVSAPDAVDRPRTPTERRASSAFESEPDDGTTTASAGPNAAPAAQRAELEIRVTLLGRTAPHAAVELVHEPATGGESLRTLHTSDANGRVRLALAPGVVRAVAWSASACALPVSATLDTDAPARIDLALEPAYPVAGRVLDAASGAPLAGATVALWTFAELDTVTTASDGSFLHPRFPPGAPAQQIVARAAGHAPSVRVLRIAGDGSWKLAGRVASEGNARGTGTPWIELELVPELALRGRVLAPDGMPAAGALVLAEGFFHVMPSVASRDAATVACDADGRFELAGLRSDIGHALHVDAPGLAFEPRELAASSGVVDLGTLALAPAAVLAGAVIDADGLPVGDVEVVLRVAGADPERGASWDAGARVLSRERRVRTSGDGAFLFEGLPAVSVHLTVERDDGAHAELTLAPRTDGTFAPPCLALSLPVSLARRDG